MIVSVEILHMPIPIARTKETSLQVLAVSGSTTADL